MISLKKTTKVSIILLLILAFNAMAATDFLDYGIYWFGNNNTCQKYVQGQNNPYYDPSKPVVIYFHGWQKGSCANGYKRENFNFIFGSEPNVFVQNSWKAAGWNVAIFYWNQFADENEVKDAEAKIWSTNGPKGMRYRLSDGTYKTTQSPNMCVGDLAFDLFVKALATNTSGNIRIVGHSLGSQLATYVSGKANDAVSAGTISSKYIPKRIALLDPAYTKNSKTYLGDLNNDGNCDWIGERVRWWIFKIINQRPSVAVEQYSTTSLDLGFACDENEELRSKICTTSLRPWYYQAWQVAEKHVVARYHYFWSYSCNAPVECTISGFKRYPTGQVAPSAKATDARINSLMAKGKKWAQVEGRYTTTPSDDWFEVKSFRMSYSSDIAEVQVMGNISDSKSGSETDISEKTLPQVIELAQNYPNPFNPVTTINFALPENGSVKLAVMNAKGETIKVLASGNYQAGNHSFDFDGSGLNSGVYFYQLVTQEKTITKKMIMVK